MLPSILTVALGKNCLQKNFTLEKNVLTTKKWKRKKIASIYGMVLYISRGKKEN